MLANRWNWIKQNLQLVQQTPWLWRGVLVAGVGLGLLISAVAGIISVKHLLEIAELPDCRTSPTDTYAERLYCGDQIATSHTINDLRDAIKFVSAIPEDDPLRQVSDRRIEQWSRDLLEMAEKSYQDGDLDSALNAAGAIPASTQLFKLAGDRIGYWKQTWEKAEGIYKQAKDEIAQEQWTTTLNTARDLLKLNNRYWSTTRYQELMDELQAAKEQQKAQKAAIKRSQPEQFKFENTDGAAHLKKAKALAKQGGAENLRGAISEAQQIFYGATAYDEAQGLIDQWERQAGLIEDRQHLNRATQLAKGGTETALQAAIDEAYNVSPSRGLYNEARTRIDQWMDQLYRTRYPAPAPEPAKLAPASNPSTQ